MSDDITQPPTTPLTHQRCWRCGNTTATHTRHDWREVNKEEVALFSRIAPSLRPTMIGRRHIECECGLVEDCPEFFAP